MARLTKDGIHLVGGGKVLWDRVSAGKKEVVCLRLVRKTDPTYTLMGEIIVQGKHGDAGRVVRAVFYPDNTCKVGLYVPEQIRGYRALKAEAGRRGRSIRPVIETRFEIVVLSNSPLDSITLEALAMEMGCGDVVGTWQQTGSRVLKTRGEYQDACEEVGTEDFFGRLGNAKD